MISSFKGKVFLENSCMKGFFFQLECLSKLGKARDRPHVLGAKYLSVRNEGLEAYTSNTHGENENRWVKENVCYRQEDGWGV